MSTAPLPKIYSALSKVMDEIEAIEKSEQGHGYKFRGIDQLLNHLHPKFKKHKILVTRKNVKINRQVREIQKPKNNGEGTYTRYYSESTYEAVYVLTSLEDGSSIESSSCGEGQDASGGDKSLGMAQSNALKYLFFEMFSIPTEILEDSDMHTAKQATKKHNETSGKHRGELAAKPPTDQQYNHLKKLMKAGKKKEALGEATRYKLSMEQTKELNSIYVKQKAAAATKEAENKAQ